MTTHLYEIANHRRAVRDFDPKKPLDTALVEQCLRTATLAPTSSNMQLWECYHVTNPAVLEKLTHACLGQRTASTAQQMVVFVTRQDLHRRRAKAALKFEIDNTRQNFPEEKHEKYFKRWNVYYKQIMPLFYTRFGGILGLFRKYCCPVNLNMH